MPKEILSIELVTARGENVELFRELDCLGIDSKDARAILEDSFEGIGRCALNIYKSAVPVRSKQLRNQMITLKSRNRVSKSVEISSAIHDKSNTNQPIPGDELADILEEGVHRRRGGGRPYRRSRNAISIPPYTVEGTSKESATARWAENAFRGVCKELGI